MGLRVARATFIHLSEELIYENYCQAFLFPSDSCRYGRAGGTCRVGRLAAQIFVARSDPKAVDKNPGTEALPFQTIQAAVDKAQAGDTIWVKQGVYEEVLLPKSSGNMETPITLSAWKDDRVRIGSILHDAPAADQWKPVEKSRSYRVKLPGGQPKDLTVVLDGKPIVTEPKDIPPPDNKAKWATYRASDRTLMLNLGGAGPAGHRIQLSRDMVCFYQHPKFGYWAFKKLEFAWAHLGLYLDGNCNLVEDCYFHDLYHGSVSIRGGLCTVRRCNFYRACSSVNPGGNANIVEDCLVVKCGADWQDIIAHRRENIEGESFSGVESKGGRLNIFRYNIVADNDSGLWYDCHMVGTTSSATPSGTTADSASTTSTAPTTRCASATTSSTTRCLAVGARG